MVEAGDDIAELIVKTCEKNGFVLQECDIIVVAQKIFSKAEGRVIGVRNVVPSAEAKKLAKVTGKNSRFVEVGLAETKRVL